MSPFAPSAATPAPNVPTLPYLADQFQLRDDITFLNHDSFGACPQPVFATYQRWQRELEQQPVDFIQRRLPNLLAEARATLGDFVGAAGDDLVFVPNATHSINIVARSLAQRLQAGDEVLTTDHEYGAVNNTWRFVCQQRGAEYVSQSVALPLSTTPEGVEAFVDSLWAGVTPRTRILALSHITSPTALIFPVAALCKRARAAGILTVIDGAHVPGHLALDMGALGADFYAGNCHKWLCAPKGAAFLYAKPEEQSLLEPLVVSHGWSRPQSGSTFLDYFSWTGTDDPAAYLSVAVVSDEGEQAGEESAVGFQRAHGWASVRAACHALALDARNRLLALGDEAMQGNVQEGMQEEVLGDEASFGQMVAAPLPRERVAAAGGVAAVRERLWAEFQVEVPVLTWNERPFVRVSIQAYNSPADVERLLSALESILKL